MLAYTYMFAGLLTYSLNNEGYNVYTIKNTNPADMSVRFIVAPHD